MFDIAICNDNINELGYIDYLLSVYPMTCAWPVLQIRRFHSLYDLIDCIRAKRSFSLYILGHSSQLWMNNLSPAAVLRREEPRGEVILLSSDHPTTLRPSSADPLHLAAVLARPVQDRALYQVLDRLIADWLITSEGERDKQPCLKFPLKNDTIDLPFSKISHLCYKNHKVTCWLADGTLEVSPVLRTPFYQLIRPLLLEPRFTQASTAWVVNMDHVEQVTRKEPEVRMNDGTRIKVPLDAITGILEEYNQYISLAGKRPGKPVVEYRPQS